MSSKTILPLNGVLRSRLVPILLAFLLVGVSLVVRMRFTGGEGHEHPSADEQLHGDADEAPAALENRQNALPPSERLPFLLKSVGDESPGLRFAAVDALGKEKGDAAAIALETAFHDSASQVRTRIVEVMSDVDQARGARLLLAAMKDEDTWVRDAAAAQLSLRLREKMFPADARLVPTLIAGLRDTNPNIPPLAIASLRKITGKPWHVRTTAPAADQENVKKQWEDWWRNQPKASGVSAPVSPVQQTRTDASPAFEMRDIDGRTISRDGQKGRVTLLNFWGTWCAPCQGEVPELNRVAKEFGGNMDVVGIALSESSVRSLRDYCRAKKVAYPQVMAPDDVLEKFGHIHEVPVTVLLDARGQIRYRWEGERDATTFRPAIQRLLAENQ